MTHPLAAEAEQALQGVTDLIARLHRWKLAWGVLPSIAPHVADAPGMTTGGVIADTQQAAAALTALSAEAAALKAQVAELTRERDEAKEANRWAYVQAALDDNQDDLEAAEAKVARLEGALRGFRNVTPGVMVALMTLGRDGLLLADRMHKANNAARAALTEGDTNG